MVTSVTPAEPGESDESTWIDTGAGYHLTVANGTLLARNAKGKVLKSVPKAARETEVAAELNAVRELLVRHQTECRATVESWMLGAFPIATAALVSVWDDPAWRSILIDSVVAEAPETATSTVAVAGFLKGCDPERGLGLVDLDGESVWLDADTVTIPHPVLLDDLGELREFAVDLGVEQGIDQLLREVHPAPTERAATDRQVNTFANAEFKELRHALGRASSNGFAVQGGYAICRTWDRGREVRGRYWIGADDPASPAWTGDLHWVDSSERTLTLDQVGPVPWSEGMRMASLIHAGRHVEQEEQA